MLTADTGQSTPYSAIGLDGLKCAIDAYLDAFYMPDGDAGFFRDVAGGDQLDKEHFWRFAEMIEVVEDAYDRTLDTRYALIVHKLCAGFRLLYTDDWSWNKFNDDVMWASIAFLRAAKQTGDKRLADCACHNFETVWDRAFDDALGGGLWWTTENSSKNACVNGPASIAASLLYLDKYGDRFKTKAQIAYDWLARELFDAPSGRVLDHIDADESVDDKVWSYNLGTFVGAGALLDAIGSEGDRQTACRLAMRCAVGKLTGQHGTGVLDDEYNDTNRNGDSPGFKGIFTRWAGWFIRASDDAFGTEWLQLNARAAWESRNSAGISWGRWKSPTPEAGVNSFECSSSLALWISSFR